MRWWRAVIVGVAVASAGLVATPPARACSCSVVTPAMARDYATAVFEGYVLGSTLDMQAYTVTAFFQVTRAWKGVSADTVVAVVTSSNGASCGVGVADGVLMLVYANASSTGGLTMHLCSRTSWSEFAQEDFDALGPPAETGVLTPGVIGGVAGSGGPAGTGGAGGTTGLVHRGGCAVAGTPAPAAGAVGLLLALALVSRRRRQPRLVELRS
jgi:MYXO-CTERM domain-containing protein